MSSASTGRDGLRFYYDTRRRAGHQPPPDASAGLWSGDLGHVRTSATAPSRCCSSRARTWPAPTTRRRDARAVRYDAYGASPSGAPPPATTTCTTTRFSTPASTATRCGAATTCGRAGTSRSCRRSCRATPLAHLNRYGYAGGNPVMRIDPSGRSFRWSRDIGQPLDRLPRRHQQRCGRTLRALLPVPDPRTAADPRQSQGLLGVGHPRQERRRHLSGRADRLRRGLRDHRGGLWGPSSGRVFAARVSTALTLGAAQSTTNAAARGFNHFNWNTFLDGEEGERRLHVRDLVRRGQRIQPLQPQRERRRRARRQAG